MSTRILVVAGAGGFIGSALCEAFASEGWQVRRIGRSGIHNWANPASIDAAIDGADVLVNLAGKSVNCRYTDANRDEILRSRVDTTRALRESVGRATQPPRVWLNSSTATIYKHTLARPNTEAAGELGAGFSVDVARAWEHEFFAGDLPSTRRVALRTAIVLGEGDATRLLLRLARTGLGGTQFDGWCPPHQRYRGTGAHPTGGLRAPWYRTRGRQKFSWVHLDDVISAVRFLIEHEDIDGVVNVASPNPSDNQTLMRTLRRQVGAPIGIPSWRWMLEAAMWVLRTEPELLLKSRWVLPGRLQEAGFVFTQPDLAGALADSAARLRPNSSKSADSAGIQPDSGTEARKLRS